MADLPDHAPFEVSVDASGSSTRLVLRGDLDIAGAPILEAEVATQRPFRSPLVLDVSELKFVDSSGLRALTAARAASVEDTGEQAALVGCRESLRKLLELTGLVESFRIDQ
jgi:anti-anti-sigma factor